MLQLVDTHAHLYLKQFDKDRSQTIQRSIDNEVQRCFLPNIDASTIKSLYQLVADHPDSCFPMMGVHPCSIKENFEEELVIAKAELDKATHKFYAVGEIGLDYYWDTTFKGQQQEAFRRQIEWAKALGLPIVIHTRVSFEDTYAIVKSLNDERLTGIFHCFVGTKEEADKIIDLGGFYMGIGGVVTYHNKPDGKNLENVLQHTDLQHFVLETDAPYLVPAPFRFQKKGNKRNESSYIKLIAERVAEIKGMSLEEVARITTQNAETIFQVS